MEAKKIVITGAATRIGAAIAKSLANYDVKILLHCIEDIRLYKLYYTVLHLITLY